MPIIFSHRIRKHPRDYRVEFSFDDELTKEDAAVFEITAGVKDVEAENWTDITLRGQLRLDEELLVLSYEDHEIARLSLAAALDIPLEDGADTAGSNIDFDIDYANTVDGVIRSLGIEEIIHQIPTDPILGCLIKGLASTAIGQIIHCWRLNRNTRPLTDLVNRIGACLRDHRVRMLFTFMYRIGRCAVLGGLR
ncbi:hypothetical protein [Rhodoferax sp.]|uniref:hypothetical protein n=1 Tax=Rhodoferax sp. TaxID=50421 RepID=UPI0025CC68A9|nr:hypothetical protein [Rhodoferax sp.]